MSDEDRTRAIFLFGCIVGFFLGLSIGVILLALLVVALGCAG